MGKELAIKGHPTRGKEVIELLEMMGGVNSDKAYGNLPNNWDVSYYIFKDGIIKVSEDKILIKKQFEIFTLEEFLEEYPFMIGDEVVDGHGNLLTIKAMSWSEDCETMVYDFEDSVMVLAAEDIEFVDDDNKLSGTEDNSTETKSCTASLKSIEDSIDSVQFIQSGKIVAVRFNTQNYENEVELQLDDYEIKIRDGKTYAVRKKPAYPKTYKECCKVLKKNPDITPEIRMVSPEESLLFSKLIMLKRCRDAYWKIAGEEIGLGKPWEPNWNDSTPKYTIVVIENKFEKSFALTQNYILAFPTEEMRDAFFENFKDLIESCKELL